jgi:Ca2+-binding RTX toxin-like protein
LETLERKLSNLKLERSISMRRDKFNLLRKFEKLEDRRMMAADISLDNGVLSVEGTDNADYISIEFDPNDDDKLVVTINDPVTSEELLRVDDIDADDVDEIVVHALNGFDIVVNVTDIDSTLYGEGDKNWLFGGSGDDKLFGGEGRDMLYGGQGDDELTGGAGGDEYILSGTGLWVGGDSYNFSGTQLGSDVVFENADVDDDRLLFGEFAVNLNLSLTTEQVVNPDHLRLRLSSATGIEDVRGSNYGDTIRGNSRDNILTGGFDGVDTLFGEAGKDTLLGGPENDTLWGGSEDDTLSGDSGNDHLYGETGLDTLNGGGNDDTLEGGAGNDTYVFAGNTLGTDEIIEAANADTDTLDFSGMPHGVTIDLTKVGTNYAVNSPNFKLKLSSNTGIEDVRGSEYNDKITGNGRNNRLYGRGGNDEIRGGFGADTLDGGANDDILWTDALDQVYGGTGHDTFDGYDESTFAFNPRPWSYKDWRRI